MFFFRKKTRLEPSFVPLQVDINTRRETAKRLLDTAKPGVVDGILILLHESHRDKILRDLYRSEAQK